MRLRLSSTLECSAPALTTTVPARMRTVRPSLSVARTASARRPSCSMRCAAHSASTRTAPGWSRWARGSVLSSIDSFLPYAQPMLQ